MKIYGRENSLTCWLEPQVKAKFSSHLWPAPVELLCLDGVLQGAREVAHLDEGGRPVAVEDVVARVQLDRLGVQPHRHGEVAGLARRVGLPHLLQEHRLRVGHAQGLQEKGEDMLRSLEF